MSEKLLGISLVVFLILINLSAFIYFSMAVYKNISFTIQQNKRFKKLQSNKCKGPHSWVNMSVDGTKTHVCRECFFSPKHDTFVKENFVKEAIHMEQFDLEYKEYFNKKIQEIAIFYNMPTDKLVEIGEKIIEIKKEFASEYIKKMIEEMNQSLEKK
jgi:hypothetical protein